MPRTRQGYTAATMDWHGMFGSGTSILEVVVRGTIMYLVLFAMLRVVLKRETGQVGISDLLVIVLIADAAQNGMAGDYKTVPDGLALVGTIVFWAWFLDWLSFHVPAVGRLVKPARLPIVRDGRMLRHNMAKELITEKEMWSQLRLHGVKDISTVEAAYVEPDGRISVLQTDDTEKTEAPERRAN